MSDEVSSSSVGAAEHAGGRVATSGPVRRRMPRRGLRTANRLLLALSSVGLLALGWYALTASAVSAGGPLSSLPSWWPGTSDSGALPGEAWWAEFRSRGESDSSWRATQLAMPIVVLVVALLALWWQSGPRFLRVLSVPGADARLRGAALTEVVAADAKSLPGVRRARVGVYGPPGKPWLRLRLTLEADAQPGVVLNELEHEVLTRARTGSGTDELRAKISMRVVSHRPSRVRESAARRVS